MSKSVIIGVVMAVGCTMPCANLLATSVVDGNTLIYRSVAVHLWGIEAPDKNQTCADGWPAGKHSVAYLSGLVANHEPVCELKSSSTADPVYGVCKVNGQDLSAAMASAGMAWANTEQSAEYTVAEVDAMSAFAGVHGHHCLKAREWRERNAPRSSFK